MNDFTTQDFFWIVRFALAQLGKLNHRDVERIKREYEREPVEQIVIDEVAEVTPEQWEYLRERASKATAPTPEEQFETMQQNALEKDL